MARVRSAPEDVARTLDGWRMRTPPTVLAEARANAVARAREVLERRWSTGC